MTEKDLETLEDMTKEEKKGKKSLCDGGSDIH